MLCSHRGDLNGYLLLLCSPSLHEIVVDRTTDEKLIKISQFWVNRDIEPCHSCPKKLVIGLCSTLIHAETGKPMSKTIESVLVEDRVFPPPEEFQKHARISKMEEYKHMHEHSVKDPEGFWGEQARAIPWIKPFDKVLEWNEPFAKWFVVARPMPISLARSTSHHVTSQQSRDYLGRRT